MKTEDLTFAPLELDRARALNSVLDRAVQEDYAVLIDEQGIAGVQAPDLISPSEDANGLVRYQRHY